MNAAASPHREKPMDVPRIAKTIEEFLPIIRRLGIGRTAISIGGSHGKKTYDDASDVDFRLFCDEVAGGRGFTASDAWKELSGAVKKWEALGVRVDYCWVRTVAEIDRALDDWIEGKVDPIPKVWTLWGYYLPTDIKNQMVIEDPSDLIGAWQRRLTPYPAALKGALLKKHADSLRYWRGDYHYANKVARRDPVFLAGISSRLVHDILQILFALNETYYVGDGNNLKYVERFALQPKDSAGRVEKLLYPGQGEDRFEAQYEALGRLMDETIALLPRT